MAEIQHAEAVYESKTNLEDHNLLITMHEQIKQLRIDIRDLKDGTSAKIQDHEMRLRRLEWGYAVGFTLLVALQFYFHYLQK